MAQEIVALVARTRRRLWWTGRCTYFFRGQGEPNYFLRTLAQSPWPESGGRKSRRPEWKTLSHAPMGVMWVDERGQAGPDYQGGLTEHGSPGHAGLTEKPNRRSPARS